MAQEADITISDYDHYAMSIGTVDMGGSVKGLVRLGDVGWYRVPEGLFAEVGVQREGLNGSQSTVTETTLLVKDLGDRQPDDFLCLWSGDEGTEWLRVKPKEVRVRVVGHV